MPAPITTTILALAFLVHECGGNQIAVLLGAIALLWQLIVFLTAAAVGDDESA